MKKTKELLYQEKYDTRQDKWTRFLDRQLYRRVELRVDLKVSIAGTVSLTTALTTRVETKRPQRNCVSLSKHKVYFEMLEETERGNFIHTSTVRGCSSGCKSRNDFRNCTHQQRTSRGCVRKDCCSDTDLCNSANTLQIGLSLPVIMIFAIEQAL
ncbi:hypothetical protein MAR_006053 [Mya arenaria]|uniref:Uncharacterized protein n=1 Tax=Mya arenaria TaxID=6604 RepID=A0ABY7D7E4_MYAAR|nr:hypothetical protein MAR_006053 [Mya arenaria]